MRLNVISSFLGAEQETHAQGIGQSHQTRNGCIEEEILREVRRHLKMVTCDIHTICF